MSSHVDTVLQNSFYGHRIIVTQKLHVTVQVTVQVTGHVTANSGEECDATTCYRLN
jgi:hypothetical protein